MKPINQPSPKSIRAQPPPSVVASPGRASEFNTATVSLAQLALFEIFSDFDTRKLSKRIEEKPELYFSLIDASCSFSRLQLAREKFEWQKKQAEARQRAREQKQRARTPIVITADTIRSLRSTMQATDVSVETPEVHTATAATVPILPRSASTRGAFLELGTSNPDLVPPSTTECRRSVRLLSRRMRLSLHSVQQHAVPQVEEAAEDQVQHAMANV